MTTKQHNLKQVALGITTYCSHRCPFCYETASLELKDRCHGDIATLKQIADQLHDAGVWSVELVGGDPSDHPELVQLVKYMSELKLEVGILSNTHKQWQGVAPYVSSLEWTVHGIPSYHDARTWRGTYRQGFKDLILNPTKYMVALGEFNVECAKSVLERHGFA